MRLYIWVQNCNCLCSVGVIENVEENEHIWDGWWCSLVFCSLIKQVKLIKEIYKKYDNCKCKLCNKTRVFSSSTFYFIMIPVLEGWYLGEKWRTTWMLRIHERGNGVKKAANLWSIISPHHLSHIHVHTVTTNHLSFLPIHSLIYPFALFHISWLSNTLSLFGPYNLIYPRHTSFHSSKYNIFLSLQFCLTKGQYIQASFTHHITFLTPLALLSYLFIARKF